MEAEVRGISNERMADSVVLYDAVEQVPSLLISIKICPTTCFSENVSSVYFSLFPKVSLKEFFSVSPWPQLG